MALPQFESADRSLKRLCVHTITTKPWDIHTAIAKFSAKGIGGISVWRDTLEGKDISEVAQEIKDAGMDAVSLVRGGFYTGKTAEERQKGIDDNLKAIDECAAIGAPMVVLVCGATPGQSVAEDLQQITEGIESTLDHAKACDVKLAIEPLHPMYADTRSAVSTMKSANDICDAIGSSHVGVAVDAFHVWWDPEFEKEIVRCGKSGNIFAYHICDWKEDMEHMLFDRGMMGEGVIDLKAMSHQVVGAGFDGLFEVEIFSNRYWSMDQDEYLDNIIKAYQATC
jgi:sugar phosphate isomerase/epimerase